MRRVTAAATATALLFCQNVGGHSAHLPLTPCRDCGSMGLLILVTYFQDFQTGFFMGDLAPIEPPKNTTVRNQSCSWVSLPYLKTIKPHLSKRAQSSPLSSAHSIYNKKHRFVSQA